MSVTSSALYLLYYFSGAAGGVVPDEVSVPDDDQEPLRRHVSVLVLVTPRCPHGPCCAAGTCWRRLRRSGVRAASTSISSPRVVRGPGGGWQVGGGRL